MHVARVYLRVSTQGQDLDRQESIIAEARDAGYYIAGIHVAREDFGTVLGRLAEATRTGGRLHGSVRGRRRGCVHTRQCCSAPALRRTYWRESALRSALTDAGWIVSEVRRCVGKPHDRWLSVRASRA
ncbi:hypothetical protein EV132_12284 [Rhizobium sullae]|uniref:Resolvase/invertase-type recombinase catalytic domain-containing protein n=1 Tax=Rhizobium sullae TaxID=50338 RepID=A0A4R3PTQ1_RHISU|nr:hypothetical protein EV132_12284 [Rhizobium sullae]